MTLGINPKMVEAIASLNDGYEIEEVISFLIRDFKIEEDEAREIANIALEAVKKM